MKSLLRVLNLNIHHCSHAFDSAHTKQAPRGNIGRESLKDDPRPGHPASATIQENINHVHHMVMNDRHLTVNQIADAVAISHERVETILHQELGMSKVSAQWVPPF